jgi:hypothetical protein
LFAFFANFPVFFVFLQHSQRSCPEIANLRKKCKKMQKKNVLPGHAANPTRKKCRKNPNSKCKMNPPYKKMQTKAAKKNKNTPSPIPTRDALS